MPPEEVRRSLSLGPVLADDKPNGGAEGAQKRGTQGTMPSGPDRYSAPPRFRDGLYDLQIVNEQHSPVAGSWSLLATSFSFEGKWLGRLTIYNPRRGRNPSTDAGFLGALVREVGPAIYGKYLVGRLRSRAQARERARLCKIFTMGLSSRSSGWKCKLMFCDAPERPLVSTLARIMRWITCKNLFTTRSRICGRKCSGVRPLEVEPARLFEHMAATVDRFRTRTGYFR